MNTNDTNFGLTLFIFLLFSLMSCNGNQNKNQKENTTKITATTERADFGKDTIFNTENLILVRLSPHAFQHISYLNTDNFGRVECNGMVVLNDGQAVVFDTPTNDSSSEELINFLSQKLKLKIIAVIPTHFHDDCVGGMQTFNLYQVPAYANSMTIKLLKEKGNKYADYFKSFNDSLLLNVGDKSVIAKYFGEGHTKDNITGYFPADGILFGGCLVKELDAGKGFLGDANGKEWPSTVAKLKQEYPKARIVIPGHGKSGGLDLLNYTELLFQ